MPRARASFGVTSVCSRIASMIWSPIVCTGLNDVIGSWNTSPISPPRIARISRPFGVELDEVDRCVPSVARAGRISPLDDAARRLDDAQDRPRGDALAAAALADDAERLAGLHVEDAPSTAFVVPSSWKKLGLQVADREQRLGSVGIHAGSQIRVGGVAEAVAHEVERQDRDDDRRSTGTSSHGEMASAWMFCASCSSTPQLIAGGRRPSPRKRQRGLAEDHRREPPASSPR